MEAAELALFMLSACIVTTLLEHPASPLHRLIPNSFLRQLFNGLAMAATLLLLIHSRWGKQSGAHMNPALTLMYRRLGKIATWDAAFYIAAQFLGGIAGVVVSYFILGMALAHPRIHFVVTEPGSFGPRMAFAAEVLITFVMAMTVLLVSNDKKLSRFTPYFAATLLAAYITWEAPLSGMSLNPARSLGSAVVANSFHMIWIYFAAPVLGMILAGELFLLLGKKHRIFCAKLHHYNGMRCIFRCNFLEMQQSK